jgi:hypothetical protein
MIHPRSSAWCWAGTTFMPSTEVTTVSTRTSVPASCASAALTSSTA